MAALVLRKLFGSATEIYFAQRRRVLCCSFSNKSPQFSKGVSTGNPTQTQESNMTTEGVMIKYPDAKRDDDIVDNYFGVKVADPYRWLENPDSRDTKGYIERQNIVTKKFLTACPYRSVINSSLKNMWDYPKYSCPFREGSRYFFFKNSGLQNQSVLYIQKDLKAEPTVFFDPNTLSEDGTIAMSTFKFSEDGSTFAYGLSAKGSDWVTIHFMNVQTQEEYTEELGRVKFSTISWTHDNKGIFYGMYPVRKKGMIDDLETVNDEHQKLYYHRLGTPQSEDVLVLEFPDEPKFRISTDISDCGRYLIVYLQKGCRDNLVYYCDFEKINYKINGKLPITEIVGRLEADYEYVTNVGTEFIFRTNKNASNYRLIKINFESPTEDGWTTLVKEHPTDVLDWAVPINKNKLMICYMHDVTDVLQYHELSDGKLIHKFKMEIGNVVGFSGKKKYSEVFFKVTSFLTPGIVYRCELNSPNFDTPIFKEVKTAGFDRSLFETKQVFYRSKDGTMVPMFLVYKKGLVLNGKNPCLLYGYGGFNISIKPFFNVTFTVFIKHLDGILAVPNIRGGGEYGEKWHNQGRFEQKQNSFNDFIAAAEYLISQKYTSSELLTIKGDSNGGLLVSACTIQRPDLFGAVLCGVGVMDMLRFHKFTIGFAWVSDYGSSDVQEQFNYLYKYSPLHNVKLPAKNVQYPAMMLTTADHDDRVVPLHSLKFIATMQHVMKDCTWQKNPLIIRVDTKAGHGSGKPTTKLIEEATDALCFIIQSLSLKFKA
ncbi:hypothetical protein RUM44_005054 [Polyplax serrata]|uniref:Prolyl endopeptidase n=1 Tax=Polyplax serrata TaxID=468196 RepID=A0ABR1AWU1_POLSC